MPGTGFGIWPPTRLSKVLKRVSKIKTVAHAGTMSKSPEKNIRQIRVTMATPLPEGCGQCNRPTHKEGRRTP